MTRITSFVFLIAGIIISASVFAQGIPIGAWRHHLPTGKVINVVDAKDNVVGATEFGLIIYNRKDNSISKFNKVHGLSDFGISSLEYFDAHDALFVGYQNGNIDIIKNGLVYNVPDIKNTTTILGSKKINGAIVFDGDFFIATDFGIVQLNINSLVIFNTLYIGENAGILQIYDLLIYDGNFYAATQNGILVADVNSPNLSDYNSWEKLEDEPVESGMYLGVFVAFDKIHLWNRAGNIDQIFYLENEIWTPLMPGGESYFDPKMGMGFSENKLWVANQFSLDILDQNYDITEKIEQYISNNARPNQAFYDSDGVLWIADSNIGIVRKNVNGQFQNFKPVAPAVSASFGLSAAPGVVWVAPGAISEGGFNTYNYSGAIYFYNEKWYGANRFNISELDGVFDVIAVTADPGNDKQAYFSSWTKGLFRLTTDLDFTIYNETNSTLQLRTGINDLVRVGGTAFDSNRNLWVSNSEAAKPVSVLKNDGTWLAFDTKGIVSNNQMTGDIAVDNQNQKWVILYGNGLLVLKENSLDNAGDFNVRRVSTQSGNGSLPSNFVYSIAVDQSGYMWVGTQKGVVVFYNPGNAFNGEAFDAQQPIVVQDGFAGLLLENDQVNTIAVDGGNNKWFGTNRSGAFFMTPDARNTYLHFNTDNSPLPSNTIFDITVEPETGEVFFATDKGLVSFRNFVTTGGSKHEDVFAYPNPVKPGYEGYIAIKGLVSNAYIKITDINGHLVYDTRAQGGQAIWNGRDLNGKKPSSGVYVVYSTNEDGSEKAVTKILFLK
jgi:ligand-binding sensor domain-containing protein